MIDSHGRNIDYMRISITDRCNLRCRYCTPEDLSSIGHCEILRFEEILEICKQAVKLGIKKFKVTGGEPLVRKGCISFLRSLKSMPGVEQVTITTNGVTLKDCIDELEEIGIDGINISLDTLNPKTYEEITRRNEFSRTWDAVLAAQASKIKTKINCVLLKGVNDHEFFNLVNLAKDYDLDVRFIEIMPIGYGKGFEGFNKNDLLALLAEKYPDYKLFIRRGYAYRGAREVLEDKTTKLTPQPGGYKMTSFDERMERMYNFYVAFDIDIDTDKQELHINAFSSNDMC